MSPMRPPSIRSRGARFALAASLLFLGTSSACGARGPTTPERPIDVLRAQAEARPRDAAIQSRLAFAELFWGDGDPARAEAQIRRALALAPGDAALEFALGTERYLHGEPDQAVAAYVAHLEHARSDGSPATQAMAELASASIETRVFGSADEARALETLGTLFASPGALSPAVRQNLADTLIDAAYRRGDAAEVSRLAGAAGCVRALRVAGPFGPRALLAFDEPNVAGDVGPMAEAYDLGPLRGARPTRTIDVLGCAANVGEGPIAEPGTTFVEAFVDVPRGGRHVLRVDTPNAVEVHLDRDLVVRRDTRREALPQETYHAVDLAAGRHEVRVRIGSRHPNPVISIALAPLDASGEAWLAGDAALAEEARGGDVLAGYLAGARALMRGDTVGARRILGGTSERGGDSTPVLVLEATVALGDPLRTADMRRDRARRILRRIREKDPAAWYPVVELASLEAAEGRVAEAAQTLRDAKRAFPRVAAVYLTLADLLLSRGWDAESDAVVDELAEVAPRACGTIAAQLGKAQRRERTAEILELAERAVACDARSDARYAAFVRARRWDDARGELARLARFEPQSGRIAYTLAQIEIAGAQGDRATVERLLAEVLAARPRSEMTLLARVDGVLAGGDHARGLEELRAAIEVESASYVGLRPLLADLGGSRDIADLRRDGLESVRRYQRAAPEYDQPQVLVLDYTAVRLYPDGSHQSLVHQVIRVQSEEAVDAQGEFSVPEGAALLRLRTIKEDGAVLEPDLIEGKETISLPNLGVGDFVEYELLFAEAPSDGLAGGVAGDRFYFQSFEQPFFESELLIVAPESLEVTFDPRGRAPEAETSVRNGLRHTRFRVENSAPLVQEPSSVSFREFVPSIGWGIGATWGRFIAGVADALADVDVADPAARRLVTRILGGAAEASDEVRARKIFRWVLANVEPSNDLFGPAAAMLAARTGHPARVLHYLYELAGLPADLVLVRDFTADQTRSELADEETYTNLLVRTVIGGRPVYLFTGAQGTPFGYVPVTLLGMDGLVVGPRLERVEIPRGDDAQDRRVVTIEGELEADGSAHLRVVESYHGAGAIAWRENLEGIPAAVLEQRFEEMYAGQLFPSAELRSLEIDGRDDPEEPIVLRYAIDVDSIGHREGARLVLGSLLPLDIAASLTRLPERTTTQIVAPMVAEIALALALPDGVEMPELPAPVEVAGPSGATVRMRTGRDDGRIEIVRSLSVPRMRVEPASYDALVRFGRLADQAEARPVRLVLRRAR